MTTARTLPLTPDETLEILARADTGLASSRAGGWEAYTVDRIAEACREFSPDACKLGIRLCFIVALGAGDQAEFSFELRLWFMARARDVLEANAEDWRQRTRLDAPLAGESVGAPQARGLVVHSA